MKVLAFVLATLLTVASHPIQQFPNQPQLLGQPVSPSYLSADDDSNPGDFNHLVRTDDANRDTDYGYSYENHSDYEQMDDNSSDYSESEGNSMTFMVSPAEYDDYQYNKKIDRNPPDYLESGGQTPTDFASQVDNDETNYDEQMDDISMDYSGPEQQTSIDIGSPAEYGESQYDEQIYGNEPDYLGPGVYTPTDYATPDVYKESSNDEEMNNHPTDYSAPEDNQTDENNATRFDEPMDRNPLDYSGHKRQPPINLVNLVDIKVYNEELDVNPSNYRGLDSDTPKGLSDDDVSHTDENPPDHPLIARSGLGELVDPADYSPRPADVEETIGPKVRTWTAKDLFDAVREGSYQQIMPAIREAATKMLLALFVNYNWKDVLAAIPSPSGKNTWKLKELEMYAEVPVISEEFRAALDHAHQLFKELQRTNPELESVPVVIAAVDISSWGLVELKHAIRDTKTRPELKVLLQEALKKLEAKGATEEDTISLVTPVGYIKNNPEYYELSLPSQLMSILEKQDISDGEGGEDSKSSEFQVSQDHDDQDLQVSADQSQKIALTPAVKKHPKGLVENPALQNNKKLKFPTKNTTTAKKWAELKDRVSRFNKNGKSEKRRRRNYCRRHNNNYS